ncbi:MAG: RNA 3'-terminal phosphate cyclase [Candidatus Methanospirare jalkutatii]|nr:RNA 3'-terminal phosphate cyclase [Candidatus Methanospirare jalkutatii]
MIEVDGSFGEGGGQIIRTAVALSAITGEPVEIRNIRANRPNPGLQAQHLNAVKAVAAMTDAETEGLKLRSTRLKFVPQSRKALRTEIDIGTAGSITLLLQCIIPVALFADGETKLRIIGGTDVKWSPPIDFYRFVFAKALAEMGCEVQISLLKRGYYPKGGGVVDVSVKPVRKLNGFVRLEEESGEGETAEEVLVRGISHCRGLPSHVASRQASSAEKKLRERGYNAAIEIDAGEHAAAAAVAVGEEAEKTEGAGKGKRRGDGARETVGSGITLWHNYKSGSALGEPRKPAESVGEEAASLILSELASASTVDVHLADQLIPYIALAEGYSAFKVREITGHLRTNIYIVRQFLDVEISIRREENIFVIEKD